MPTARRGSGDDFLLGGRRVCCLGRAAGFRLGRLWLSGRRCLAGRAVRSGRSDLVRTWMRWRLGVGDRRSCLRDAGPRLQGLDPGAQLRGVLPRSGAGSLVGCAADVLDQPALRQLRRLGDQGLHALVLQPGAGGGEFRHLGTQGGRHGDRDGWELLQVLHRIGHPGAERALFKACRIGALLDQLAHRLGKGRVGQDQLTLGHNLVQLCDLVAQRVTLRRFSRRAE